MTSAQQAFNTLYALIATKENWLGKSRMQQLDNWSSDRFELNSLFAGIADGGYSRWVGRVRKDGSLDWRVNDYYPNPMTFDGVSEEEFIVIVGQITNRSIR